MAAQPACRIWLNRYRNAMSVLRPISDMTLRRCERRSVPISEVSRLSSADLELVAPIQKHRPLLIPARKGL